MSRIGKMPIKIIDGVNVKIEGRDIIVTGPKGVLELQPSHRVKFTMEGSNIVVSRTNDDKKTRALHGLWRMLLFNAISGVSEGWERKLDFKGVGFKAEVQGNKLVLALGFSHPVEVVAPEGISFLVTKNVITVSGIDKQLVGQVAANIRRLKPVEPYKQKGIKYLEEIPRKKLGKAAKAATTTA